MSLTICPKCGRMIVINSLGRNINGCQHIRIKAILPEDMARKYFRRGARLGRWAIFDGAPLSGEHVKRCVRVDEILDKMKKLDYGKASWMSQGFLSVIMEYISSLPSGDEGVIAVIAIDRLHGEKDATHH